MGEHTELTRKAWDISRARQDEIALASHRHAVAARDKLAGEICPVLGIDADSGPRADTSIEALGALRPVFDPEGMLTAGNSSPVTDGASAVLLMSEERARSDNLEPLAFIRTMAFAALDPSEGLLMAPAITVPRALSQSGLKLSEIDLIEIHEAFGAQVLANAAAWEKGWKGEPTGAVDWDRVNVNGSSIAIGHPWAATGGRIVTTLANEIRAHLSSGCDPCEDGVAMWTSVLELAKQEASFEPPVEVLKIASALFAQLRPQERKFGPIRVAELLFDSFRNPLPAGVRSLERAARHLSYKVADFFVDVRIEEQPSGGQASVVGQLLHHPDASAFSLEGLPVVLTSGRATLAETTTNQFGEFMFEMDSERENHLAIAVGDEFALVVPLGRRRGHA